LCSRKRARGGNAAAAGPQALSDLQMAALPTGEVADLRAALMGKKKPCHKGSRTKKTLHWRRLLAQAINPSCAFRRPRATHSGDRCRLRKAAPVTRYARASLAAAAVWHSSSLARRRARLGMSAAICLVFMLAGLKPMAVLRCGQCSFIDILMAQANF
jgi:hypothetical protein